MTERMNITSGLEAVQDVLDARLRGAPPPLRPSAELLRGARGKCIRARLCLIAASDRDGLIDGTAVRLAAAIELLHLATLVHDDVLDDADTRRGCPSVMAQFDAKTAILAGDWLLCAALMLVAEVPVDVPDARDSSTLIDFAKTLSRLCAGQLSEYGNTGNLDLTPRSYLRIIGGKTASLMALSLRSGAELGGLPRRDCLLLQRFGHLMGMAFQLVDDCIDYAAAPSAARKPTGRDLKAGVVTLPVIFALAAEPVLRETAGGVMNGAELARSALMASSALRDGVAATRALAERYSDKAAASITKLNDPAKRSALLDILTRTVKREA